LPFVLRIKNSDYAYVPLCSTPPDVARPLAAVIVMERKPDGVPSLSRITRSSVALSAILPHAYCFSTRDSAANRSLMSNYLNLVGGVAIYALHFPPGLEGVPAIIELLESTLGLPRSMEARSTVCAE
jgi:hypothetical protein